MVALLGLAALLGFAAAYPQASTSSLAPTTSMTFLPLPSSLLNPTNQSMLYSNQIQAAKPPVEDVTGVKPVTNTTKSSNSTFNRPFADASCSGPTASNPSTWWREQIDHNGIAADINDDSYVVFRSVLDYGADNSGSSDASSAINSAIADGDRVGNGLTTRPAYIYVPGGTYKIASSVQMRVNTFLVGDPLNLPKFVAASSLGTNPIIQGFDDTQQSTTNFYTVIRNLELDTTSVSNNTAAVGLNWAVSQACHLFNVNFNMLDYSNHIGIEMNSSGGGGSGTIISDCNFNGGAVGIQMSNQQYSLKGLTFNGCNTCINVQHLFLGTFQDITFENCAYGVDMSSEYNVGAISLIDSSASSCYAAVRVGVTGNGEGSLVLDNVSVDSTTIMVLDSNYNTLVSGSIGSGSTWVMGNENPQNFQSGTKYQIDRPSALVVDGKYLTMKTPQYEQYAVDQFINVKSVDGYTVYGDNSHDDTAALNAIISQYAGCKILFFPQGIYRVTSTLKVPSGSLIIGEVYSVISGYGDFFSDESNPQPVVQIGSAGETGSAQITDMLFTVGEILPGAIILQVNLAASSPGAVAVINSHFRVGGAADTSIETSCTGVDTSDCMAAFALMHISSTGSGYFENIWGWTADHDLDGGSIQNIATGRGLLVEATAGVWLVGTAFEHNTMYQYNLHNAQNVYIGMQQVESPYWQGYGSSENAPNPWSVNSQYGDPDFAICNTLGQGSNQQCHMAWGMMVSGSSDVVVHGSAFWVFFNNMSDGAWANAGCPNYNNVCQLNMVFIDGAERLFWYNMETKSTTNMVVDGSSVTATQYNNPGGWEGSVPGVIAAYLRDSGVSAAQ